MANFYKNAFYDPTTTAVQSVYTTPADTRSVIQNIQITNEGGSKVLQASINDASASTVYQIAYASISGPTICNLATGPVVLEESDSLRLQCNTTTAVSGVVSILEMNRSDQNG